MGFVNKKRKTSLSFPLLLSTVCFFIHCLYHTLCHYLVSCGSRVKRVHITRIGVAVFPSYLILCKINNTRTKIVGKCSYNLVKSVKSQKIFLCIWMICLLQSKTIKLGIRIFLLYLAILGKSQTARQKIFLNPS